MPHFTIEYSANMEDRTDIPALCEVLRKAGVETGLFPMPGIRVRAIRCDTYTLADGVLDAGFIDISVRLRGGRSLQARKDVTADIFAAVETHLAPIFAATPFALSFEMRDIDPELSPKRSSIRDFL